MIKLHENYIQNSDINIFGDWVNSTLEVNSEPFKHVLIHDFLTEQSFTEIEKAFPSEPEGFYTYENPIEVKYAFDNFSQMKEPIQNLFSALSHPKILDYFSNLFQIQNLQYDPCLHGAGLHMHPKYGRLNIHLDYEKHPLLKDKQRKLNIIFYINKDWKKSWNGATELWSKDMKECLFKSYPEGNKALVFETNEISWHGLPEIIDCPEGTYRKSIAYYYLTPLENSSSCDKVGSNSEGYRTKATFVKRPQDPIDERMEKLYSIRPHRRITKEDMIEIYPEWNKELR